VINWYAVVINSFWILGLAILLAAFSYHYWLAPQADRRLIEQLNQPSFLGFFWLGIIFVCIGLAGTSSQPWESRLWIIFLLISVVNAFKIQGRST
jgi:hypothetical protein